MNAPLSPVWTFPPNPTVGQVVGNYCWNGSMWVCRAAGPVQFIKVFAASGSYFPSPGLTFLVVEMVGGGGGGGGSLASYTGGATLGYVGGGGGGGSGSYSRASIQAPLVVNGVPVTIGAGGAGGSGGTVAGGNGGQTLFGALVTANGGFGSPPFLTAGQGASGGPVGTGDVVVRGNAGHPGAVEVFSNTNPTGLVADGGVGGVSFFGGGGMGGFSYSGGVLNSQDGHFGTTGSGGGGGSSFLNTASANGGAGGAGLVVITEWCFGNINTVADCGCSGVPTDVPTGFQMPAGMARGW